MLSVLILIVLELPRQRRNLTTFKRTFFCAGFAPPRADKLPDMSAKRVRKPELEMRKQ